MAFLTHFQAFPQGFLGTYCISDTLNFIIILLYIYKYIVKLSKYK